MANLFKLDFRPVAIFAAVVIGLGALNPLSAQTIRTIYTWTDQEGVTHFSAYPPQDHPYELVSTRPGRGRGDRSRQTPEMTGSPPPIPSMSESQPDPNIVAERCEQARSNLDLLSQDRPAVLQSDDGDPQPLDETQRQEMIEETEAFIEEWC
jgi:hypothetical protein